ncbi:hypothetical protein [Clostridium ihumii]|nr:hypothetical protein [Clostridium ihumii]
MNFIKNLNYEKLCKIDIALKKILNVVFLIFIIVTVINFLRILFFNFN